MKCIQIRIYGKVQGVWFRASTQRKATSLGLTGFVRNEPDGSVYVEVNGPEEEVDQLVAWCHKGPELASVKEVVCTRIVDKHFDGFQIFR